MDAHHLQKERRITKEKWNPYSRSNPLYKPKMACPLGVITYTGLCDESFPINIISYSFYKGISHNLDFLEMEPINTNILLFDRTARVHMDIIKNAHILLG
jgi:hypothetical protein